MLCIKKPELVQKVKIVGYFENQSLPLTLKGVLIFSNFTRLRRARGKKLLKINV